MEAVFSRRPFEPLSTALYRQRTDDDSPAMPDLHRLDTHDSLGALDRIRPRSRRRALTVAVLAAHAVTVVLIAGGATLDGGYRAVELVALAASIAGYLVLRRVTGSLADEGDTALDERQTSVRDRAYLVSYRILGAGVTAALLAVFIAVDGFDVTLDARGLNALFWAVTGTAIALPTFVVAWGEREV